MCVCVYIYIYIYIYIYVNIYIYTHIHIYIHVPVHDAILGGKITKSKSPDFTKVNDFVSSTSSWYPKGTMLNTIDEVLHSG